MAGLCGVGRWEFCGLEQKLLLGDTLRHVKLLNAFLVLMFINWNLSFTFNVSFN